MGRKVYSLPVLTKCLAPRGGNGNSPKAVGGGEEEGKRNTALRDAWKTDLPEANTHTLVI